MCIKLGNKNYEGLLDFLHVRGFHNKVNVMKSTGLTFKSGLNEDDIYFFLIVNFQPMSIRASDTEEIKLNDRYYVYLYDSYCLIEDINDRENSSLQLYRKS